MAIVEDDFYHYERPIKKRIPRQIVNNESNQEYVNTNPNSVNIFSRPKEERLYLDSFLQSCASYKLGVTDFDIKEDLRWIKEDGVAREKKQHSKGTERFGGK